MRHPKWLDVRIVLAIHERQVAEHGGSPGVRDLGLLESAIYRPQNESLYQEPPPSIFGLAASYGFGIVKNHAFVDGNKRAAFMAMYVFLRMNGFVISAPEPEVVLFMLRLATGEESQDSLETWLTAYSKALPDVER
ncbi:MAG: type II toxin-antitoxin system death-on-curing family toxin [Acaryochloris sp. RU_4_1]|nr:type II toxin-antitoxin system death-on-curing family toxin [Acaryochloris sp. RU_4_1]